MNGINLCSPALIYLIFSMTQVIVDTIKGTYQVALVKSIMMILFTLLLNILCERGLGIISWIIVFIPFVLTSVITTILIRSYGIEPSYEDITRTTLNDESETNKYINELDNDLGLDDDNETEHSSSAKHHSPSAKHHSSSAKHHTPSPKHHTPSPKHNGPVYEIDGYQPPAKSTKSSKLLGSTVE